MFSRDDILKAAAILIVLFFVFEAFAYQGAKNQGGGATPTPTPTPAGGRQEIGLAQAEARVSSYPEGVIMAAGSGVASDAALQERLREFSASGRISYYNSAGPDLVNIVLPQGADASDAAWNLTLSFPDYGFTAKAQIELPASAVFVTASGNVTSSLRQRPKLDMEPLVSAGENVSVVIRAMIVNGAVEEMEVQLAEKQAIFPLQAKVRSLMPEWSAGADIPWEGRAAVNASRIRAALNATYPNTTVDYSPNSFITTVEMNESEKAALNNVSYVLFITGKSVIVEEDFVNRSRAEADFAQALGRSVPLEFPASELSIKIRSEALDESVVEGITGAGNFTFSRAGELGIGDVVSINGRRYALPGGAVVESAFPANSSVGDNVTRLFPVTVKGARIVSIG